MKISITFDDGNISTVPADACVLELKLQDDGTWAFYDASNSGYLYAASSSSNYLKTQPTLNDNAKATITVDDANGVATIKFQGANTHNWLRYNTSGLFSCYGADNTQKDVYLYLG